MCFFFFQAEDGIRDLIVTGVQTCALPIFAALAQLILLSYSRYSLTMMAWANAAMATASSTLVETSNMRNSSVPNVGCGRTSHQIFLPLSMQFSFTRRFMKFS